MTLLAESTTVVRENLDSLAIVTAVTAVVMWFSASAPDTTTRIVSTLLAAVVAFGCAAVGLALLSD